jgi:hypothetical protein
VSAHTPGPWSASFGLTDVVIRRDQKGHLPQPRVCKVLRTNGQYQANAYVISAAPDMLAVLKKIRNFHVNHHVIFEIDAAIAKATGETE